MIASYLVTTFLFSILIGLAVGAWWSTRLGQRQGAIAAAVQKHFHRPHKIMHHVTMPTRTGTTEIDHIIIADTGIFIIEAKHYSGLIFGTPDDAKWTQVLYRARRRFQNPIRQNFGHLKVIRNLFHLPDENFIPLVVFTGSATIKTDVGPGVIRLVELGDFLNRPRPVVFNRDQMAVIIGRIELSRLDRSSETDEQHINNVRTMLLKRRR
ncbi:MAG: nuclease-related domain-containing protein [Phycisphaerae bacterium]